MSDKDTTSYEKAINVLTYMDLQGKERSLTTADATTGYALAQVYATLAVADAIKDLHQTYRIGL